jgi:tetraacyldisaccharide 4'-kinase
MVTTGLRGIAGEPSDKGELLRQPLGVFCGVGNPESFLTQVRSEGLQVGFSRVFPDHYNYSQADIDRLTQEAKSYGVETLLTTAKDAIRLGACQVSLPCHVLEIRISIDEDELLRGMIRSAISGPVAK